MKILFAISSCAQHLSCRNPGYSQTNQNPKTTMKIIWPKKKKGHGIWGHFHTAIRFMLFLFLKSSHFVKKKKKRIRFYSQIELSTVLYPLLKSASWWVGVDDCISCMLELWRNATMLAWMMWRKRLLSELIVLKSRSQQEPVLNPLAVQTEETLCACFSSSETVPEPGLSKIISTCYGSTYRCVLAWPVLLWTWLNLFSIFFWTVFTFKGTV